VFAFELSELWCTESSEDVTLRGHTKGALVVVGGERKGLDLETKVVEKVGKLEDGW
jgi:hypothetical protein